MQRTTYKGDFALTIDGDGDAAIEIKNGQPRMTEFFDTYFVLLVFGVDSPYNDTVKTEAEKMKSKFPEFLKTASVTDKNVAKGISLLNEALQPLITKAIAEEIFVDGEIISVFGIRWTASIFRSSDERSVFSIIWEKGILQFENNN
jgi:hypothetical protein